MNFSFIYLLAERKLKYEKMPCFLTMREKYNSKDLYHRKYLSYESKFTFTCIVKNTLNIQLSSVEYK